MIASLPIGISIFLAFFAAIFLHSTSHAPIFYAKKMIAHRLRRFFEVNLFYSLCSGREKAPPRRVGQHGEAQLTQARCFPSMGSWSFTWTSNMLDRSQPSKKQKRKVSEP
jgi:hypothetical protein